MKRFISAGGVLIGLLVPITVFAVHIRSGGVSDGGGSVTMIRLRHEIDGPLKEQTIAFLSRFQSSPQMVAEPTRSVLLDLLRRGLVSDIQQSHYSIITEDCSIAGKTACTLNNQLHADVTWSLVNLVSEDPTVAEFIGTAIHESGRHLGLPDENLELGTQIAEAQMPNPTEVNPTVVANIVDLEKNASVDPANFTQNMRRLTAAAAQAMNQIAAIRSQIRVGQMIDQVNSSLHELRAESVVDTKTDNDSASAHGFGFLLSLLGGGAGSFSASYERHSELNTTRVMTLNPEDVESFDGRKAADFANLQYRLHDYLANHAKDIAEIKELATQSFQLIGRMYEINRATNGRIAMPQFQMQQIDALYRAATELSFWGQQYSIHCIETRHAGYTNSDGNSEHASGSAGVFSILGFGGVSASANHSYLRQDIHPAYTETTCSNPEVQTTAARAASLDYNVNFSALDESMRAWAQWAAANVLLSEEAPPTPNFGNPYFTQNNGDGLEYLNLPSNRKRR